MSFTVYLVHLEEDNIFPYAIKFYRQYCDTGIEGGSNLLLHLIPFVELVIHSGLFWSSITYIFNKKHHNLR